MWEIEFYETINDIIPVSDFITWIRQENRTDSQEGKRCGYKTHE